MNQAQVLPNSPSQFVSTTVYNMGFPVFPSICSDLLPMLIINIAVLIALMKHTLNVFLHVVGLVELSPSLHEAMPVLFPEEYNPASSLMYTSISEEVLQALPVTVYNPSNMDLMDVECPVCLSEFQQGQEIRLLPACKHVYHRKCLDQWLDYQHMTCPLCRTSLVPEVIVKKQQRRREHQLSQEVVFWFQSFHGAGFQSFWHHL